MAGSATVDRSKRALLRRPAARGAEAERVRDPWRPPWAVQGFEDACTRCGACLEACPEGILTAGDGGFPEVDVSLGSGECTFCRACVESCPEPAFLDPARHAPWTRVAEIGHACLTLQGVHCQTCQDMCDWQAIAFVPEVGGPPRPRLDAEACTGCGACIAACPADAIRITRREGGRGP
jgi:ferredoxin-type protein NapF